MSVPAELEMRWCRRVANAAGRASARQVRDAGNSVGTEQYLLQELLTLARLAAQALGQYHSQQMWLLSAQGPPNHGCIGACCA